jgi:hypothetical protein
MDCVRRKEVRPFEILSFSYDSSVKLYDPMNPHCIRKCMNSYGAANPLEVAVKHNTGLSVRQTAWKLLGAGRVARLLPTLLLLLMTFPLAKTACGQGAGALLGVVESRTEEAQEFQNIQGPKYQTLWVAPDATGKLAVLATIPELIVPRRDGFWHAGVKQVCEFRTDPLGENGNERITQVVWSAPIAKAGVVPITQPCTNHAPGDYAPPYGRSEADKNKISQCGFELRDIEFASPVVLSIRKHTGQSEDCEARGGRYNVDYSVIRYQPNEEVSVRQMLGREALKAYLKALPSHGQGDDGEDCGATTGADTGWRIGRNAGRWGVYAHQDLGYFGCAADALVRFRLPSSLTGDTSTPPDSKQLSAKFKGYEDAYSSPTGDMLMVVTSRVQELPVCCF